MAIGLTFEEYVEHKRTPAKNADSVTRRSAERSLEEIFPMTLVQAAGHVRTRGFEKWNRGQTSLMSFLGKRTRFLSRGRIVHPKIGSAYQATALESGRFNR